MRIQNSRTAVTKLKYLYAWQTNKYFEDIVQGTVLKICQNHL